MPPKLAFHNAAVEAVRIPAAVGAAALAPAAVAAAAADDNSLDVADAAVGEDVGENAAAAARFPYVAAPDAGNCVAAPPDALVAAYHRAAAAVAACAAAGDNQPRHAAVAGDTADAVDGAGLVRLLPPVH